MRNIDDTYTLGFQLTDDLEQGGNFLLRQGGGGLVQDQDLGAECDAAGNLDHLLLGDGEVADIVCTSYARVELVEGCICIVVELLPVNCKSLVGQGAKEHVFGNGQVSDQGQFLEDHDDAGFLAFIGSLEIDPLTHVDDLAFVSMIRTVQALHEC